jgi:propanol-preferring alcohol dehydrogenase
VVFAPSDDALAQAMAAVKPGGRVVLGVFATVGEFPFVDGKTLIGSVIGSRQQMRNVLTLAARGDIKAVVETAPLDEAQATLQRLKAGEVRARAVLTVE